MDVDTIVRKLTTADLVDAEALISELSEDSLSKLLQIDQLQPTHKAIVSLYKYDFQEALTVLNGLGHYMVKQELFSMENDVIPKKLTFIANELISRIIENSEVATLNYYSSLDEYEHNPTYLKIAGLLSFLQTNHTYEKDEQYHETLALFSAMCSLISDAEFISLLIGNLFYKPHSLVNPLKKQLTLLYTPYFIHEFETDQEYYNYLQSKKYPFTNLKLKSVDILPFDVIYNILSMDLLSQQNHDIVSMIDNQERLISLIQVDNLVGLRDIIFKKLNRNSILRLLNDYKFMDILHLLNKDDLHSIFYEVDKIEGKAIIAKKLKSNTLAFETLQQYFEDYGDVYLTSDLVRDLFILLKLKQLALFRLSLPSEYHQLLRDMIKEKEKQDRNDYSMFA